MNNTEKMGAYVPKKEDNDYPLNGEIREYDGVSKVVAIGKEINGEFAYADLSSALDVMSAVLYGGHKVACVEVPDNCLPGLLITHSGKIYHTKTHYPYSGAVITRDIVTK